jgi:all-trans-8'-apo-beta-carotenal 15,15'-oxygenase
MQTDNKPSFCKDWSKAFEKPAQEFPLTPLPILSGKIPAGLRGSLYRNGPARLQRGGILVGHWFDGDGAILAVHFADGEATGVYRYVQTVGYQQEEAAHRFLFPNYGMTVPGPFWNNWGKEVKNPANTSVLALPDKLLALWEGGNPYSLSSHTLATLGIDNLSGLDKKEAFSAHPKIDPQTGEIFNFGVTGGGKSKLNLYQSDPTGKVIKKSSTLLKGLPLIHDFVMAGQYLLFFVSPVRINLFPVICGFRSFSEAMGWLPELGTQILVFDRATLALVSRGQTDPWYQWHFTNGYVERDGAVVVELVRLRDFQTNQYLKEVATGKTQTPAKGTLWQIRLNPQTGNVIEQNERLDRACEFPVIPQERVGKSWRYTYLSVHRDNADISQEFFGAIARFDRQTGDLSMADMGESRYPSEPIYAPDGLNAERGWVLTVVYDGDANRSEVRIYESDRLEAEPVCRLGLPSVIPPGFHGTWKST